MTVGTRLLVPLAIWMALGTWAADPLLAQVMLQGRVLDDVTGQPLQGARVLLLNRYDRVVDYQVTDDDGSFRFKPRNGSRLRVEVKAISYLPTITPVLWMVSDRDSAAVVIRLAPHAVPGQAVAASTWAGPSPASAHKYARCRCSSTACARPVSNPAAMCSSTTSYPLWTSR